MGERAITSRKTKEIDLGLERIFWSFVCRSLSMSIKTGSIKNTV
jgi:hypothetical protein